MARASNERIVKQAQRPAIGDRIQVNRSSERRAEWSQGDQDLLISPEHRKLPPVRGHRRSKPFALKHLAHLLPTWSRLLSVMRLAAVGIDSIRSAE